MNLEEAVAILTTIQLTIWDFVFVDKIQEIIEWLKEKEP